jgi:hypothetical protein
MFLSKPHGIVRPEGLGKFKKSPHRYLPLDLPACNIVPQPLGYRVPHEEDLLYSKLVPLAPGRN